MITSISDFLKNNPDLKHTWETREDSRLNRLTIYFPNSENIRDKQLTKILKSLKKFPYLGYVITLEKDYFFYRIFPYFYMPS